MKVETSIKVDLEKGYKGAHEAKTVKVVIGDYTGAISISMSIPIEEATTVALDILKAVKEHRDAKAAFYGDGLTNALKEFANSDNN